MTPPVRFLPTLFATLLLALAVAVATAFTAAAQAPQGSVAKIKERGKLLAGVKLDTPPFGFLNDKNEPAGFDIDLVRKIAERIGVPVELVKVTSPTRIPLLVSGNVDLVAASMTHTRERDKAIDFSITYYTGGQSLLGGEGEPDHRREGPRRQAGGGAAGHHAGEEHRGRGADGESGGVPRLHRRVAGAGAGPRRRAHRQPARPAGLHEGQSRTSRSSASCSASSRSASACGRAIPTCATRSISRSRTCGPRANMPSSIAQWFGSDPTVPIEVWP